MIEVKLNRRRRSHVPLTVDLGLKTYKAKKGKRKRMMKIAFSLKNLISMPTKSQSKPFLRRLIYTLMMMMIIHVMEMSLYVS